MTSTQAPARTLVSITRACPPMPLTEFLRRVHGQRRILWDHADAPVAWAGAGVAAEVITYGPGRLAEAEAQLHALLGTARLYGELTSGGLRAFGGASFDPDATLDGQWEGFAPAHFVVPRLLLARHGGTASLTLTLPTTEAAEAPQDAERAFDQAYDTLFWDVPPTHWDPEWEEASSIEYPMHYDDWSSMVHRATAAMRAGTLDKVVLARMGQVRFRRQVNVVRALDDLAERYPATYRFLFEPTTHSSFYGATPETLVRVDGSSVYADALAGSLRRGATPEDDAALGAALLADAKERSEHAFVVEGLRAQLAPLASQLDIPQAPALLKLKNIQHLHTPVRAVLRAQQSALALAARLHPTPALGGAPRDVAAAFLRQHEPLSRGWYAAPIGWVDAALNGVFAVAIRSAVARHNTVWMMAGAGVVAESTPEREWQETNLKFRPMLNALGIDRAL